MIPSAEEFLRLSPIGTLQAMRNFAKLHVEAALKEAADNSITGFYDKRTPNELAYSILTAYDLSNIK